MASPRGQFSIEDLDPVAPPTAPTSGSGRFSLADLDPEPTGPVAPGNIDLFARPQVLNPGGSISTVRSMSFTDEDKQSPFYGKEILVPTADEGRILSDDEAADKYYRSPVGQRQYLGVFDTPESATRYAEKLHSDYAAGKYTRDGRPQLSVNGAPIEPAVSHHQPPPMRPAPSNAPAPARPRLSRTARRCPGSSSGTPSAPSSQGRPRRSAASSLTRAPSSQKRRTASRRCTPT
jgi:hypothetical protein